MRVKDMRWLYCSLLVAAALLVQFDLFRFDLSSQPAPDQPATAATLSEGRLFINLDGVWRISPLSDTGDGKWSNLQLPLTQIEEGSYSIRKRVELSAGDAKTHRWVFHAERIVGRCDIYCNRKLVGSVAGTGEPVELFLGTSIMRDGANEFDLQLHVASSNRRLPLSHELYAKKIVSGLDGAITLERIPITSLEDSRFTLTQNGLRGFITLNDQLHMGGSLRVGLHLIDHSTGLEAAPPFDSIVTGAARIEIAKSVNIPEQWSANSPHLYEIITTLARDGIELDRVSKIVAARSSICDKQNILVNGAPAKIKAITYYEPEWGSDSARNLAIDKDLDEVKLLGANTLRFPEIVSEYLLAKCDALGLMVLADLPISGLAGGLAQKEGVGLQNFTATIDRYGTHPSVIAIGCGAENDYSDARVTEVTNKIAAEVKARTGLLTYAVTRFPKSSFSLDIAALSTFGLTDATSVGAALEAFSKTHYGKRPMILASCGSFCRIENKAFMGKLASMNEQSKLIASTFKDLDAQHFVGLSAMTLLDFQAALPSLSTPSGPHDIITSGLLDPDHMVRPAARILQSYFTGEGKIAIAQSEPESPSTLPFLILGFVLLLIFFVILNLDRRFREYVKRALMRPFNFFADIRDQRLIPNAQTTILSLIIGGSWALVIGGLLFGYREHYSAAWAVAKFVPSGLQSAVVSLAWQPWLMLIVGMLAVFFLILIVASIIRFCAIFVRGRIFYTDALNVTSWALMPSIFLLPLGMILPRLDHTQSTAMFTFVVLILLKLWLLYRLMKGVGVLFDIYPTRIYLFGSLGVAVAYLLIFFYLNATTALAANWPFFIHLTKSTTLQ